MIIVSSLDIYTILHYLWKTKNLLVYLLHCDLILLFIKYLLHMSNSCYSLTATVSLNP
ncbi:hypothetical protein L873DRAFT_330697 [Choiromyces venosus 120613-1]|uniref:Uncharacterized protein n=1 Tax=Choiromyces venosus 120613-1 TaxID=1336337 RepID=A0A3N4JX77_9PEZI|nr:hypothetical protein L873DRAFT_330697 [Choiromyces venosus 120613-1]